MGREMEGALGVLGTRARHPRPPCGQPVHLLTCAAGPHAQRSREAGPLPCPPRCVQLPSRLSTSRPSFLPTTVGFRKKRKRNQEPQEGRWQVVRICWGSLGGGLLSLVFRTWPGPHGHPTGPHQSTEGPALLRAPPHCAPPPTGRPWPLRRPPGLGLTPVPFPDLKQELMDLRMMLKKRCVWARPWGWGLLGTVPCHSEHTGLCLAWVRHT